MIAAACAASVHARSIPSPAMTQHPPHRPPSGFAYSREQFQRTRRRRAGAIAKALGASDAGAEVSEGCGLSVSVRKGELENVERNRDKSIGVTVYVGQRRGNASTSDFSRAGARADGAGGLRHRPLHRRGSGGRPARRATTSPRGDAASATSTCSIPGTIDAEAAAELALRCEAAAFAVDRRITNSRRRRRVGAAVAFLRRQHARLSRRLCQLAPFDLGGADRRARATTCSATPGTARCASPDELAAPEAVGRYAAERALSRLKSRKIATCEVPVLFESPLAAGLLGAYVQATSGGALYRKASFLLDSLGKPVLPDAHRRARRPARAARQGQRAVRRRGRATRPRAGGRRRRGAGLLPVELFGAQARHADHRQRRRLAQPDADSRADRSRATTSTRCCASCGRGLFVIELMGQGVNYVTGDYSRGAAGFWVENGRDRLSGAGDHDRRQPARHVQAASWPSAPTPTRWAARRSARCWSSA